MWLFLWVIFVLSAAGFFLWSYYTTFEQKKAWKAYAQKNNLTYVGGRMLDSPEMSGEIKGRLINFYPMVVENSQGRMVMHNVVEVFFKQVPDVLCVVTSQGFKDFIRTTGLTDTFTVGVNDWPKNVLAYKTEDENPEVWFLDNPRRVEAIRQLTKLPFHTALVADGEQAFVALRTTNPLSEPTRLNQLVRKLNTLVEMLEADEGQRSQDTMAKPKDDNETDEPETSAEAE